MMGGGAACLPAFSLGWRLVLRYHQENILLLTCSANTQALVNMTLLKTSDTILIPGPEDSTISLSLSSRSDNSAVYKVGGDSKKDII